MMRDKHSFVSNMFIALVGDELYYDIKSHSRKILKVGTFIIVPIFLLSFFFHATFISKLLSVVTGTSLIFIIYAVALVVALDVEVEVIKEETCRAVGEMKIVKDGKYKRTRIWGICLICFGIAAVYFTNEYRHRYSFECDTFWVDKQKGIYHLDFDNDCSIAEDATSLTKMKGFEIETTNIGFCPECEEWAEDAESDYNVDKFYRR